MKTKKKPFFFVPLYSSIWMTLLFFPVGHFWDGSNGGTGSRVWYTTCMIYPLEYIPPLIFYCLIYVLSLSISLSSLLYGDSVPPRVGHLSHLFIWMVWDSHFIPFVSSSFLSSFILSQHDSLAGVPSISDFYILLPYKAFFPPGLSIGLFIPNKGKS